MLDDDMIKRLAHSATMIRVGNFWHASLDDLRTFSSACYAEGQRDAQDRIAELERDAARYEWLAKNAIINHDTFYHDGEDPASSEYVLGRIIDAAMRKEADDAR